MPRKRMHPLISALHATIPEKGPWPAEQRESYMAMERCAFDVAFGKVEGPPGIPHQAALAERVAEIKDMMAGFPSLRRSEGSAAPAPPPNDLAPKRYTVEVVSGIGGVVMCNGKDARFDQVPPGTVIVDMRTEPERGDDLGAPPELGRTDNILWADCGTRPDGTLPAGVTMRAGG